MIQIESRLLPLGSVIRVSGARLLVVVARGLMLTVDGEPVYVDYGACLYPEGMIGDSMLYLNADDVVEVVHEGFSDEDDARHLAELKELAASTTLRRGDTGQLRQRAMRAYQRAAARDGE